MKKFFVRVIFVLIPILLFVIYYPYLSSANEANFALSAISADRKVSKCVNLPQDSLLSALRNYGFNPLQDDTGFIYSLVGYAGPKSSEPASQNSFWSLWVETQNDYIFSELGPQALQPSADKSYVFYFGDGRTKPPLIKYSDVCREPESTPTLEPTPTPTYTPEGQSISSSNENFLQDSLQYLKDNYQQQSAADQDWAAMALAAFNQPISVSAGSDEGVLSLSRKALALSAQKIDGSTIISKIKQSYSQGNFGDPNLINDDIFATLAIVSTDKSWLDDKQEIFETIISSQRSDGSFGYSKSGSSDVDMTAAAVWALRYKRDYPAASIDKAIKYLNSTQNSDGGFGYQIQTASNIASSAWAAMAYTAVSIENAKVFDYLMAQKQPGGYWLYAGQPSYKSTSYAVMALSKKIFPFTISNPSSNNQPSPTSTIPQSPVTIAKPKPVTSHKSTKQTKAKPTADSSASASAQASSQTSSDSGHCTASASASASVSVSGNNVSASSSSSAFAQCD